MVDGKRRLGEGREKSFHNNVHFGRAGKPHIHFADLHQAIRHGVVAACLENREITQQPWKIEYSWAVED